MGVNIAATGGSKQDITEVNELNVWPVEIQGLRSVFKRAIDMPTRTQLAKENFQSDRVKEWIALQD